MFRKPEYVYAVYEEKSFTKAAGKLYISQPSLSEAIKSIESEVGAPLFDRSRGAVTPTEIGLEYIKAAKRILDIKEEFLDHVNDIYDLNVGHITVGGSNYLSSYVLPGIITRFSEAYPNIKITLMEAKSETLQKMIHNEEVDLIVDSFDQTFEEHVGYPLLKEEILLCVPSDHSVNQGLEQFAIRPDDIYQGAELSVKHPVSIELFQEEAFILLKSGNDMHRRAMDIFEGADVSPSVSFFVDQLNISYFLSESGMGLCFLPDTLFRFGKFRDKVTLYRIDNAPASRMLYVAHKKNKYCTSAMKKFIEIAKEVLTSSFRENS